MSPDVRVPERPRPSALPGVAIGVGAGLLLAAIWRYGARDVAFAVSAVFLGLVTAVVAGAPDWRQFGFGLLAGAVVAIGVLVVLVV